MSKLVTKLVMRFTRQIVDPNGDLISLNEHCQVSMIAGRAVVLKQGLRLIAFYDRWPEEAKLKHIRDELIRVMKDPRNASEPDWSILEAQR